MTSDRTEERSSQSWRRSPRFKAEALKLGRRIRALRHERGWTLAEASRNMDVDLRHLQKVEAGKLNVTLVTLVRIANGLRKPFAALCGRLLRPRREGARRKR